MSHHTNAIMTVHSSLRESSINIRFPRLGAEEKKVKRMHGFVTVLISDSES